MCALGRGSGELGWTLLGVSLLDLRLHVGLYMWAKGNRFSVRSVHSLMQVFPRCVRIGLISRILAQLSLLCDLALGPIL